MCNCQSIPTQSGSKFLSVEPLNGFDVDCSNCACRSVLNRSSNLVQWTNIFGHELPKNGIISPVKPWPALRSDIFSIKKNIPLTCGRALQTGPIYLRMTHEYWFYNISLSALIKSNIRRHKNGAKPRKTMGWLPHICERNAVLAPGSSAEL